MQTLLERANHACELCTSAEALRPMVVAPHSETEDSSPNPEHHVLVCSRCEVEQGKEPLDNQHWHCLRDSAWSTEPPIQVTAWRLLSKLPDDWARELREQLYLDDETMAWAQLGQEDADSATATVDSNGTPLADGDTVTLIKDLDVKGGGFTAKRGAVVKNIRLTDNPEHIEGQVNKQMIVLVTRFLKKA